MLILPECILIDDDVLVHLSWKMAAKPLLRVVESFRDPDVFFLRAQEFDRKTPIYVDLNLGNNHSGQDVCRRIHELGFEVIYISTGYSAGNPAVSFSKLLERLPFLKGIVGKDPPFQA